MSGDAANEESGSNLPTIADDLVVTKYKMAAEITNKVLKEGVALCVAGASVREICSNCDERVEEETAKVQRQVVKLITDN